MMVFCDTFSVNPWYIERVGMMNKVLLLKGMVQKVIILL